MTEEEFREKERELEEAAKIDPGHASPLVKWGDLLHDWANSIADSDSARAHQLFAGADEKYQEALSLDDLLINVYESLARLYLRMAEGATPAETARLHLEASIFELGAGSACIIKDDMKRARKRFTNSFDIIKNSHKISVIPFTFLLGLDCIENGGNKKYLNAAKKLLPAAMLSGHEEVTIICNAISEKKLAKPVKPTLTAQAAFKLAGRIMDNRA